MLKSMATLIDFLTRSRVQLTLLYSFFYLWLGMLIASPGPSLLAFSRQTGAPLTQIVWVFTARSCLYLVGSFSGFVFERFDAHRILVVKLLAAEEIAL